MNRLLFFALMAVAVLAPLPLGSNREWSWTLLSAAVGAIALLWATLALHHPPRRLARLPRGVVLLFALVAAWAGLQAVAWSPAGLHHPLWAQAGQQLGESLPGAISLAPQDTLLALMRLGAYALCFALCFRWCQDRRRAAEVFRVLALGGAVYATFGLAAFWGLLDDGFLFRFQGDTSAVRGPFVNRNNFATYLGLCALCTMAWLYRDTGAAAQPGYTVPGRPDAPAPGIERFVLNAWGPLTVLVLLVAALMLTHSRAGFASFVAGALALVLIIQRRRAIFRGRALAAVLAVFALAVAVFWITSEVLLRRMNALELDAPERFRAYALTQEAIADNPWLGFGYGSFADSFRLYRDPSLSGWLDKAHNSYLETVFELGWPAALAWFALLAWLAALCWQGWRFRGRDWIYPATGVAATLLVGIHAAFDFSLQIPAVAVTYACLLGAACAQAHPSSG